MKKLYVTTSIPYVNAEPHIGFALELVQADVVARFRRLTGWQVHFQTGTDENATKNVIAAQEQGVPTAELVAKNSERFRQLVSALHVSTDAFIRTTEDRHHAGVHAFWRRLRPQDIYKGVYRGLYCPGCEDFVLERDLVNGRCPDHAAPPIEVSESNYFFRLSAYQDQIERLLADGTIQIVPETRRNEVLSFVRRGLSDISISRSVARAQGWGIAVPHDPQHIIYVWIDALINYISGLGFGQNEEWVNWWNPAVQKLHVVGKNVWKFHAIYWPALLLSAGLPLPNTIAVHGFVTVEGRKIGKSLGNAIDPFECIRDLGSDAVRYYLLKAIPPFGDGDFSRQRFKHLYNTDLANGLGNLASRIGSLCSRIGLQPSVTCRRPDAPEGYEVAAEQLAFDAALGSLWKIVNDLNLEIEQVKPWELLKSADTSVLRHHLTRWTHELARVAFWLEPLLPNASARLTERLRVPPSQSQPLFPRR